MSAETPAKTVTVAFILCVVFSLIVSTTAVVLKDKQDYNKDIDLKKNILVSAGLLPSKDASNKEVEETFKKVQPIVIEVTSGKKTELKTTDVDIANDVKDNSKSIKIASKDDIAALSRRPKNVVVYIVKEAEKTSAVILPIVSKGLWSTMYGFLALDSDTTTIKGFAYYSQGETPGLGGEVENPKWMKQWIGKKIYDVNWSVLFQLKKGTVVKGEPNADYMVDGLSGATITSVGVSNSIQYWLGKNGFGTFLAKVRNGEF
ncbi:MAG: Na(+)-translocating NADH-quinone reductase subunit C [Spirochaetota bacterium]